ncbi:MAG: sensor histidine kinase [Flavobacteriales bacterium]|nr:MAG: sensor histidine kinase [Flavobacteriales bacterium]
MKRLLSAILIVCFTTIIFAQQEENLQAPVKIYNDRVTDQNGQPLSGIRVRVKGKVGSTYTDANGEFSIKAKKGDIIELSKDGRVINTYRLDGSLYYQFEDEADVIGNESKAIYKKSRSVGKSSGNFNKNLKQAKTLKNSNPLKSIDYIRDALEIATKNNNQTQLAQSYYILGDIYMVLKQYDLAIKNYKLSLSYSKDLRVSLKLAKAFAKNGEAKKAILRYKNSLSEKGISMRQKITAHTGLGDTYMFENNHSKAVSHYRSAMEIAKTVGDKEIKEALNLKLSQAYEATGDLNRAEQYLLLNKKVDDNKKLNAARTKQAADFYSRNNEVDKEVQFRKQALEALEESDAPEQIMSLKSSDMDINTSQAKLDLGKALLKQKKYTEALPVLEESAREAGVMDDISTQKEAVQQLSETYANLGKEDKALSKYREYVALVDKLYDRKQEEIDKIVALNRELLEKETRISSLEKDRELNESRYQLFQTENKLSTAIERRQQWIIYSLFGGLALLLVALYFMYRSNKQRKLANNVLALRSLRTQMNPHFIFNALNSVNNFIAKNDERAANRYLSEFSTLMRSVLDNSEEDFISLEKELELLRLYLKLEHARFVEKFNYELNIDKKIDKEQFQIPPMLLQPYVENAVWHGLRYKKDKGFLKVNLHHLDNDTIKIEIIDNGIGRTQSKVLKTGHQKKKKSKGMQNIKQRIKILNSMYKNIIDVGIEDLNDDKTGTKVTLLLKKY